MPRILESQYRKTFFYHELLRSQEIDDENYEISILLTLISKSLDLHLDKESVDRLIDMVISKKLKRRDLVYASGSGTSVGGDDISLDVKATVVIEMIKQGYRIEKIYKIISLPFESSVRIRKNQSNGQVIINDNELIIPVVYFLYDRNGRDNIIKQVMEYAKGVE